MPSTKPTPSPFPPPEAQGPFESLSLEQPAEGEADAAARIAEGWRRELPDLDISSLAVSLRLISVAAQLEALASDLCAELGIDASLYRVLSELRRAPGCQRKPRDLIRVLPISSGGLTSLLDRAEAAGLAVRLPDPNDRRGVVVELRPEGRALIESAVRRRGALERRVLACLNPAEQRQLEGLLLKLLQALPERRQARTARERDG